MVNALTSRPDSAVAEGAGLQQLLHGYSEGHRLLQGSTKLPDDVSRIMLRMSDLSGSGVARGFEEYITGYPLPAIKAYALAKTWYAPEMPRPGCVWTHTILIPDSAVPEIMWLRDLVNLFRRPAVGSTFEFYGKPLPLDDRASSVRSRVLSELCPPAPEMFWSFYGHGGKPVVISAASSDEFQAQIFALWSQQWPSLRRTFTFCTGALGARTLAGAPLSLQCTPPAAIRSLVLEIAATTSVEPILLGASSEAPPPWALRAAADAAEADRGDLRDFLWSASDEMTLRQDFVGMVKIFEKLEQLPDPASMLVEVAGCFPEARAGGRLKSLLFGQIGERAYGPFHEAPLLLALGTTESYRALDADALKVNDRGKDLCARNPEAAKQLLGDLFRSNLNPLGEEMLAGVISALDPEAARRVTADQPQFLPALFRAKPSLASSPQLWVAAGHRKWDLFEAVAANDSLDADLVGKITAALLESGADFLLRRALENWGKGAAWGALDWIAANHGKLSEACRGPLTFHIESVMGWVEAGPDRPLEGLVAAAHIVAPYSYDISRHDASVWLRTLRTLRAASDKGETIYLALFVFALGIGNAPPSPVALVSESFELVHEAARRDLLGDDVWVVAEPVVPHLSWIQDWDKCERLRRGLISAFIRYKWPPSDLKRCVQDKRLLGHVLESARKVEGGKHYFSDIN